MGAFGSGNETELEALFSEVAWYRKLSFADFLARVREARQCGFAVDRGMRFQCITQVSVPVLSLPWELLRVLTAAGHAHDFDGDAVGPLSCAMQSAKDGFPKVCDCCVSGDFFDDAIGGRQHGWIASGC